MLSTPKCNVSFHYLDTKEQAETIMAQPLFPTNSTVSEWNRKMARKHITQTLRLAAKTAKEHPSDKFMVLLYHEPLAANLVKMGVDTDQIVQ